MTDDITPGRAALAVERAYRMREPLAIEETPAGDDAVRATRVIQIARGQPRERRSRRARLVAWAIGKLTARQPDFVIGGREPYLMRWWVIPRNRFFNVYLHLFLRDDDDRAHHDHPWVNASVLLQGRYFEHKIRAGGVHVARLRQAGSVVLRLPTAAHRITLINGAPCWSLFLTGPVMREWGFHCPRGWVPWRTFTNPEDGGATVGRGCGEAS